VGFFAGVVDAEGLWEEGLLRVGGLFGIHDDLCQLICKFLRVFGVG